MATECFVRWAANKRDGGTADKRALEKDVLPEIGALAIQSVTRRDIVRLLDKITDRGAPIMANRVHALVHRLFNFGLARGLLTISPVVKIGRSAETPRKRSCLSCFAGGYLTSCFNDLAPSDLLQDRLQVLVIRQRSVKVSCNLRAFTTGRTGLNPAGWAARFRFRQACRTGGSGPVRRSVSGGCRRPLPPDRWRD